MIWFSSDWHYGHKNLCLGVSEWKDKEESCRRFNTIEEMNEAILASINKYVKQDDTIYFIGDFALGGLENVWNFRKRIICRTIHFVAGNHEQHIKKNKQIIIPRTDRILLQALNLYDEFVEDCSFVYSQDLFTSYQTYLEVELEDHVFVLSHYPIEEWFEMDRKGGIMLHGHCHHRLDDHPINMNYRRMDIGIDWKEFRPYSIEEIIKIMDKRPHKKHNS